MMPTECAHATCRNVRSAGNGITFHCFPKDPSRMQRWAFLMRRKEGWKVQPWHKVCSAHFVEADFDRTGQTTRLRDGVEPSVFCLPPHLQKVSTPRHTANSEGNTNRTLHDDTPTDVEMHDVEDSVVDQLTSTDSFHSYAASSEENFKEKWLCAEDRSQDLDRQLQNALKREKRTKLALSSLLDDLKQKTLLTEKLQGKLDACGDFPIHLFNRGSSSYTNEQKEFAVTLHSYGPKAYDFVASKLPLPSTRTLRRWLSNTDGSPGMDTTMLNAMEDGVDKNPSTHKDVALMLNAMEDEVDKNPSTHKDVALMLNAMEDEVDKNRSTHKDVALMLKAMLIRKRIAYDSQDKEMHGFVDLGNNSESDTGA